MQSMSITVHEHKFTTKVTLVEDFLSNLKLTVHLLAHINLNNITLLGVAYHIQQPGPGTKLVYRSGSVSCKSRWGCRWSWRTWGHPPCSSEELQCSSLAWPLWGGDEWRIFFRRGASPLAGASWGEGRLLQLVSQSLPTSNVSLFPWYMLVVCLEGVGVADGGVGVEEAEMYVTTGSLS